MPPPNSIPHHHSYKHHYHHQPPLHQLFNQSSAFITNPQPSKCSSQSPLLSPLPALSWPSPPTSWSEATVFALKEQPTTTQSAVTLLLLVLPISIVITVRKFHTSPLVVFLDLETALISICRGYHSHQRCHIQEELCCPGQAALLLHPSGCRTGCSLRGARWH